MQKRDHQLSVYKEAGFWVIEDSNPQTVALFGEVFRSVTDLQDNIAGNVVKYLIEDRFSNVTVQVLGSKVSEVLNN